MHKIKINFGTAQHAYPKYSLVGQSQSELLERPQLGGFNAQHLIILNQVHGTQGYVVEGPAQAGLKPYAFEGDYSISQVPGVALALETADCIPPCLLQ